MIDELSGEGNKDELYDPEELLNQIINQFKESQKMVKQGKSDDDEKDDNQEDLLEEKDKLMTGLIQLTRKIIE